MSYFFSQSLSQVKNSTGKKYTKFQIVKGHDGHINQIKGETNNGDIYHVEHDIKKKNDKTGMVISQHKVYKIKSSDLQSILKESQKATKATKDPKKIIILKESPKKVSKKAKVIKVEKVTKVTKVEKPEKVKKTSSVKKAPKKVVKKEKTSSMKKVKKVKKVKQPSNEK
jgi:valyl-tRNA synthetase